MAVTLQLSQEQAAILLPFLSQVQEGCEREESRTKDIGPTPISSPSVMSIGHSLVNGSSNISTGSLRSRSVTPCVSESETSGIEQFSLGELFSGKKKNSKSTAAHNFLHISVNIMNM